MGHRAERARLRRRARIALALAGAWVLSGADAPSGDERPDDRIADTDSDAGLEDRRVRDLPSANREPDALTESRQNTIFIEKDTFVSPVWNSILGPLTTFGFSRRELGEMGVVPESLRVEMIVGGLLNTESDTTSMATGRPASAADVGWYGSVVDSSGGFEPAPEEGKNSRPPRALSVAISRQ